MGLLVKTLTPEYKYSRRKMHNFPQEVQAQLSLNRKAFYGFLIAFIKFTIFKEKKVSVLAEVFPKLLTPKEVDTQLSKRLYFRTRFGKECVSAFETLLQPAGHDYY